MVEVMRPTVANQYVTPAVAKLTEFFTANLVTAPDQVPAA
jgi:hypothetical protein